MGQGDKLGARTSVSISINILLPVILLFSISYIPSRSLLGLDTGWWSSRPSWAWSPSGSRCAGSPWRRRWTGCACWWRLWHQSSHSNNKTGGGSHDDLTGLWPEESGHSAPQEMTHLLRGVKRILWRDLLNLSGEAGSEETIINKQ